MRVIRIGTRGSRLALWQSNQVANALKKDGFMSKPIIVETTGDINQDSRMAAFDSTGVFTDALDEGLINEEFDLAVHSLKDVPTILPNGIEIISVFKRGNPWDVFVPNPHGQRGGAGTVGTSSIRRSSQWLKRHPGQKIAPLRGNVDTRLRKLYESPWDGIILAHAGLSRIGILPQSSVLLDWMLPAPAQAILSIAYRQSDKFVKKATSRLVDVDTEVIAKTERTFLHEVAGGCSAPVGALATITGADLKLEVNVLAADGSLERRVEVKTRRDNPETGLEAAELLKTNGGDQILKMTLVA